MSCALDYRHERIFGEKLQLEKCPGTQRREYEQSSYAYVLVKDSASARGEVSQAALQEGKVAQNSSIFMHTMKVQPQVFRACWCAP